MVRSWKAGNYPQRVHKKKVIYWYQKKGPFFLVYRSITPKIGNWSVFVLFGWLFVFGMIMRWDGREPTLSDAVTTLGNNKAASLLPLRFTKVSSAKDHEA